MEDRSKSDYQDDHGLSRVPRCKSQINSKSTGSRFRSMTAIILAVLQILLLLLKAYFSKDDDRDRAWKHVQDAQAKLNAIAQSFEDKNRYSKPDPAKKDQFQ